jgi:isocitrate dehydrogenase (NAD+)
VTRASSGVRAHAFTLIQGVGVGPEIMAAARRVLEGTGVRFEWDVQEAGEAVIGKEGTPLPKRVLESLRAHHVGFKGPITTPVETGFRSVNVALRRELDLYSCVRPCKSYAGIPSPFRDVDLVILRENTEDLYVGIEFEAGSAGAGALAELVRREGLGKISADSGISLKPVSRRASERIARYAFEYARRHGRRKVTAVHKANIMKLTDGLFLRVAREVAAGYPDVAFEERIVDALCMALVRRPQEFDVLLLPNLYGDIVSDLAAGLVGGLGVAPGANVGDTIAVFEPTHGSAPSFRGSNRLNPTAQILSGVLMLRHLGESEAADRLEGAVARVLAEGRRVTADLKEDPNDPSAVSTSEMADAVLEAL